ncbi:MAG: sulfotransferase, partial [Phycisphaerales bacterium]|nr:sulfotransferase [Phycisphaerales bacterium]
RRDVDAVDVHPDTPEEYGFLLDNLHAGLAITRRHLGVFRYICETVRRDQPPQRTLLLKNPWDFGNAATIRTLIPEARFVFIHRNPLHVLSSLYRLIVSAVTRPSAYMAQLSDPYRAFIDGEFPLRLARTICRTSPGFIVRGIVLHAAHQAARHLRQRAALGAAAMDIHFDALCDRPSETIAAILDLLRLNGARHDYRSMIGPHRSSVASEIASHREQIIRRLGAYAAAMGYDLPRLFTEAANPMETHPAVANPTGSTP